MAEKCSRMDRTLPDSNVLRAKKTGEVKVSRVLVDLDPGQKVLVLA